jgi:Xaa-Pro aminopeptidase
VPPGEPREVSALLLYGDTEHSAALRHEVPIAIIDPLLYAEDEGRTWIMSSTLERQRLASCRPDAELLDIDELGLRELVDRGLKRNEIDLELASRAAARTGITEAIVDFDFPLAVADRLRSDGISLRVDNSAVTARRRRKSSHELAGIRRAQLAAEAAMAAAAALLGQAQADSGSLWLHRRPLTAERLRDAIRDTAWERGALMPPDVIVASVWQGTGHEPGRGPLPSGLPIEIDLWPCDQESGCWADMTRTFVAGGEAPDEVRRQETLVRRALDEARAAVRPGVNGRELHDHCCELFEAEGYRTQRTGPGDDPSEGFSSRWATGSGCASTKRRTSGGPAMSRWSRATCSPSNPDCGSARSAG